MKKAEAKEYTCPLSMAAGHIAACLGSSCAAWRWSEPKFGSVETRRGYCGMAGEAKYPLNPDNESP